jgi:hypothetical protein
MDIRKMNMFVNHGFVPVRVGMRFDTIPRKIVCMLVMHVMAVSVSNARSALGDSRFVECRADPLGKLQRIVVCPEMHEEDTRLLR